MKRLLSLIFALFVAFGTGVTLVGCEQETATQDAIEDQGDAIEDATDEMGDAAEEAGDAIEEKTDQ